MLLRYQWERQWPQPTGDAIITGEVMATARRGLGTECLDRLMAGLSLRYCCWPFS